MHADHDQANTLSEITARAAELLDASPAEAVAEAEQGCVLATELNDRPALARNLFVLGGAAVYRGEYDQAESELRRALDIASEANEKSLVVQILRTLLKCAFFTHNTDAALLRGIQALKIARESGDRVGEALTQNDLGLVYGNQGDFEGALEHLLAGLRILREVDSTKLATLLNNIGNVYMELEEYREALGFFRSGLEEFQHEGRLQGEAIALGNIGRAWAGLGRHHDALKAYQQSLSIYEQRNDAAYLPPALARVAAAQAALAQHADARKTFEAAVALIQGSSRREFEDEVLAAVARYHLRHGDPHSSIAYLRRQLEILPPEENSRRVYEVHEMLSTALEAEGDLPGSLFHFKEFHRVCQAVSDSAIAVRVRGLMLQFDVEQARQQEEIFRLKNVEMARANEALKELHARLEEQNRELHQISMEDSLTGLFNRRYLEPQLTAEISRTVRYRRSLCAAMCDVDSFKKINDDLSHVSGDEVLRRIAGILRDSARLSDILIRFGGDEFLLILPETDLAGASVLLERVRQRLAAHPWYEIGNDLSVTLSVGLALLHTGEDGEALLANADACLYEAKRSGKNRVVSR